MKDEYIIYIKEFVFSFVQPMQISADFKGRRYFDKS